MSRIIEKLIEAIKNSKTLYFSVVPVYRPKAVFQISEARMGCITGRISNLKSIAQNTCSVMNVCTITPRCSFPFTDRKWIARISSRISHIRYLPSWKPIGFRQWVVHINVPVILTWPVTSRKGCVVKNHVIKEKGYPVPIVSRTIRRQKIGISMQQRIYWKKD